MWQASARRSWATVVVADAAVPVMASCDSNRICGVGEWDNCPSCFAALESCPLVPLCPDQPVHRTFVATAG